MRGATGYRLHATCMHDTGKAPHGKVGCLYRVLRHKRAAVAALAAAKATPKAMTPSAAYPYYEGKPMVFRGVKVKTTPAVSTHLCAHLREDRDGACERPAVQCQG